MVITRIWSQNKEQGLHCLFMTKNLCYFGIRNILTSNYMFKVKNRITRTRCEIYSKLIIKTTERRQWRLSGIFIVNFEHISHFVLIFIANFEQVNAGWRSMKWFTPAKCKLCFARNPAKLTSAKWVMLSVL